MLRRYACIKDGSVIDIQLITEESPFIDNDYDFVFDVTNAKPKVRVGYIYEDNKLFSSGNDNEDEGDELEEFLIAKSDAIDALSRLKIFCTEHTEEIDITIEKIKNCKQLI